MKYLVFLFRIHLIRIRIQHFRLNTDPDPDPIRIQGSDNQNLKKCTVSLQPSKENIQHFFLLLWVIFALLDPDPDTDPLTWLDPDPKHYTTLVYQV